MGDISKVSVFFVVTGVAPENCMHDENVMQNLDNPDSGTVILGSASQNPSKKAKLSPHPSYNTDWVLNVSSTLPVTNQ